jgi:serine protease AprX
MGRFKLGLLLSVISFFVSFSTLAQTEVNRYAIYFKDKNNSTFSINQPEAYLSARSLERRQRQNIPITTEDLPVNKHYIDSLTNLGFYVFYKSKWTNSVLVQDTKAKIDQLVNKSFIDSVKFLAPRAKLNSTISQPTLTNLLTPPPSTTLSSAPQNAVIGADKMHAQGVRGQGKLIVVLDGGFSGVNKSTAFQHLFDSSLLVDYFDFVSFGRDVFRYDDHGTNVLSTITAKGDNYIGIAPSAKIALYVTEESGSEYVIEEYNLLLGIERADSIGADVINSSVGYNTFDDSSMDYTYADMNGKKAIGSFAANKAVSKGMVYVSSAGNEGNKSWKYVTVPADSEDVLAIGATTGTGSLASFSSIGPTSDGRLKPDLIAMGSPTVVLNGVGQFENGFGTSYSAPQIAGLAAGVWQTRPEWTSKQVVAALRSSGDMAGAPDNKRGYGIPNFERAINGTILSVKDILADKINVYPNPFLGNEIYIQLDKSLQGDELNIMLYNTTGQEIDTWKFESVNQEIMELKTQNLVSGQYYITFVHRRNSKTVKLIKY